MSNQPNHQAPEERLPEPSISAYQPVIKADGWTITVYTDPLCVWSWAMRPAWFQFLTMLESVSVTYRMAGLIPSWTQFSDHQNAISKPIQMGPEWAHARAVTGVFVDDKIWIADPPASSYPSCIAVKAAGLQGNGMGDEYFYRAQRAVMAERRNIAKMGVLQEIAEELAGDFPGFDAVRFAVDLVGTEARRLFRMETMDWKYLQAGRLPAIIFKNAAGRGGLLTGYQTLAALQQAVASLV